MKPEDYVHRIGRTGRAGRDGLAVTLAERMDAGMIRRIQQFTTQPIPVATIGGLEPKRANPKSIAPRPHAPRRDAAPRGNPFDRALPVRDARSGPKRRPGPAFQGRGKPQRSRAR
jgi:superfamily II DNA/RNA helicase